MVSHPEVGSDPPIESDRESGCDMYNMNCCVCCVICVLSE